MIEMLESGRTETAAQPNVDGREAKGLGYVSGTHAREVVNA